MNMSLLQLEEKPELKNENVKNKIFFVTAVQSFKKFFFLLLFLSRFLFLLQFHRPIGDRKSETELNWIAFIAKAIEKSLNIILRTSWCFCLFNRCLILNIVKILQDRIDVFKWRDKDNLSHILCLYEILINFRGQ